MQALDLRLQRPRGPRVRLAGVSFTARVIDKLRASLSGGNLNGYFDSNGFSLIWQRLTGISLKALCSKIAEANTEEEVVTWIDGKLLENGVNRDEINEKMGRSTTTNLPQAWIQIFEETYPAALRERYPVAFDLFEADDNRLYA